MPSWAPDGNRLGLRIFTGQGGIWTVRRVNGVWQKPVERPGAGSSRIGRPTAATLAFSGSLTHGALWIMPADSGAPRLLADTTGPRALRGDQVAWSDDGCACIPGTSTHRAIAVLAHSRPAAARPSGW